MLVCLSPWYIIVHMAKLSSATCQIMHLVPGDIWETCNMNYSIYWMDTLYSQTYLLCTAKLLSSITISEMAGRITCKPGTSLADYLQSTHLYTEMRHKSASVYCCVVIGGKNNQGCERSSLFNHTQWLTHSSTILLNYHHFWQPSECKCSIPSHTQTYKCGFSIGEPKRWYSNANTNPVAQVMRSKGSHMN